MSSPLPHAAYRTMVDDPIPRQHPITIVNDIRTAFEQLSQLGQYLLRNDIDRLAARVDTLITRHQWPVVDHAEFDRWLTQTTTHQEVLVILDNLALRGASARPGWVRLDAHRCLAPGPGLHLAFGDLNWSNITAGSRSTVTIVDDAAYTGDTLGCIAKRLTQLGVDTIRVRVAVSTPRAVESLNRQGMEVITFAPLPAAGDIIHARDLYPWLPYSGRRPQSLLTEAFFQRSIAPLYHEGGKWLSDSHLATDPVLHQLASAGLIALQNHLGREVLPEDVALLGSGVSVPVCQVTTAMPLGVPMLTHTAFRTGNAPDGSVCNDTLRGDGPC